MILAAACLAILLANLALTARMMRQQARRLTALERSMDVGFIHVRRAIRRFDPHGTKTLGPGDK